MTTDDRKELQYLRDRVEIAKEVLQTAEDSLHYGGHCGHDEHERHLDAVAMAKYRLHEAEEDLAEFEVMIGLRPMSEIPAIGPVTSTVKEVAA